MDLHSLEVELRSPAESGKRVARRLRREGMVPGNLISLGQSTPVSFQESSFDALCQAGIRNTTFLDIEIKGGESGRFLVKELQRHPVSGQALHVDFYRLQPGRSFFVQIPLETTGMARGVKAGGVFEQYVRRLPVRTLPEQLKEVLEIDISDMDVGASVCLRDLQVPAEWDVRLQGNPVIVRIAHSRLVTQSQVAEGTAESAASDISGS